MPFTACPFCETRLRVSEQSLTAKNGLVCPKCKKKFRPKEDPPEEELSVVAADDDEGPAAAPPSRRRRPSRPPVHAGPARRRRRARPDEDDYDDDDDDDDDRRRRKGAAGGSKSKTGLIVLLCVGGFLLIVLVGGGIFLYMWMNQPGLHNQSKLKVGMSEAEVAALLGKPNTRFESTRPDNVTGRPRSHKTLVWLDIKDENYGFVRFQSYSSKTITLEFLDDKLQKGRDVP